MIQLEAKNKVQIKEAAEFIGVSAATLRNWENFFNLEVPRDNQNSRNYDEITISTFKEIKRKVATGQSLKEIKAQLDQENTAYNNPHTGQPYIEVIQEEKAEAKEKFDLIVQPLIKRLDKALDKVEQLQDEKAHMVATMQEEQNKLYRENAELRAKLQVVEDQHKARKWWSFWK